MTLPVKLRYVPLDTFEQTPNILGAVSFGRHASTVPDIAMQQLGPVPLVEVFEADREVERSTDDGIVVGQTDDVLFGFLASPFTEPTLAETASAAYLRIGRLIARRGFPYFLRVWNHVPKINSICEGLEQYQRFSLGRHEGLAELKYEFNEDLPAASAVGSDGATLDIFFIAARRGGEQLENPRQMSAYRYPREYGPRSPSFSRATLKRWGHECQLFVSGTASIVGHASVHHDDVEEQLNETIRNLDAVFAVAEGRAGRKVAKDGVKALKVYVRSPEHRDVIDAGLRARFGDQVPMLFLRADICRSELLLEIEAYAELA